MSRKELNRNVEKVAMEESKWVIPILIFEILIFLISVITVAIFPGNFKSIGSNIATLMLVSLVVTFIPKFKNMLKGERFIKEKIEVIIEDYYEKFAFIHKVIGISKNYLAVFNKEIFKIEEIEKISYTKRSISGFLGSYYSYDFSLLILFKNKETTSVNIYKGKGSLDIIDKKHNKVKEILAKINESGIETSEIFSEYNI